MNEYLRLIERYNFWTGQVPRLGFLRETYTNNILNYIDNRLIKVLVGQRRAGKSYILRQIAHKLILGGVDSKNILYINKEFIDFDFVNNYKDLDALVKLYRGALKPIGKVYLFIDEIQSIHEWERFANSYSQDFSNNYELFISGSNSKMLSGELATLLSGRYVTFEIFPFSFTEYAGITNKPIIKQSYVEYMETGGLPELFALPNEDTKRNYVNSVKDTVLLRDVIQRYTIKDPRLLEDLFVYLVNNASNLLSVNNIANYMKSSGRKTSYDTVANYIGHIEETFLAHKVVRFDIRGKETISGISKYYINDLAYKNYLYSGYGYGVGYKLENLIYLDLRRMGYEVFVGVTKNKEVDFVAKKADKTVYIQSAYLLVDQETIKREYGALEEINDNYKKVVVSLDDLALPQNNGIEHIQAWNLVGSL